MASGTVTMLPQGSALNRGELQSTHGCPGIPSTASFKWPMASGTVTKVLQGSALNHRELQSTDGCRRFPSAAAYKLGSSFIKSTVPTSGTPQLLNPARSISRTRRKGCSSLPAVRAKTAGAAKTYETEVDKPLGLTLGQKPGGGVMVTNVDAKGNAGRAGIKAGDQVLYVSSFFGDELWPADNVGFTRTAVNAKPDSVYFVLTRGVSDVDVKRLPKRPLPPRFGRKLTDAQKERASHVCLDCGYIYTLTKPFDEQTEGYLCPQCQAPKKRFARYDPATGRAMGGGGTPIAVLLGVLVGAAAVGALAIYGLQ